MGQKVPVGKHSQYQCQIPKDSKLPIDERSRTLTPRLTTVCCHLARESGVLSTPTVDLPFETFETFTQAICSPVWAIYHSKTGTASRGRNIFSLIKNGITCSLFQKSLAAMIDEVLPSSHDFPFCSNHARTLQFFEQGAPRSRT